MNYSASKIGGCTRMLVAERLGHKPQEPEQMLITAAEEGNRHEPWIAEDLRKLGYKVSEPATCVPCGRNGLHVETELDGKRLAGHIDRIVSFQDEIMFGEFKALSRFRSVDLIQAINSGPERFLRDFPEYAFQVAAYYHSTNWPCLYAVKNRDTGDLTVMRLGPEFYLPVEVLRLKVESVEQWVKTGKLPLCEFPVGDFFRERVCPFRYMTEDVMNVPWETYDPMAGITPQQITELKELAVEYIRIDESVTNWEKRKDEIKARFAEFVNESHTRHYVPIEGEKKVLVVSYMAGYSYITYPKEALVKLFGEAALKNIGKSTSRSSYLKFEVKED